MTTASPWDALLRGPRISMQAPTAEACEAKPGTKTASLLQILAERGDATTLSLAVCADLDPRLVWGLLKGPRQAGQVVFNNGRWSLVPGFAGRAVERAAALLRGLGWQVVPPRGARP
jgi:hypothetical protein